MMMTVDPLLTPFQYGVSFCVALLCAGLFITNQVTTLFLRQTLKAHSDQDDKNFEGVDKNFQVIKESQEQIMAQQTAFGSSMHDVAESIKSLAAAITIGSDKQDNRQREQLDLLHKLMAEQNVLSINQTTITNNTQRLMEKLIEKLG